MMIVKFRNLVFLVPLLALASCSDGDPSSPGPQQLSLHGVFILNEGNFQRGNASLSLYLPDSGRVRNDVFRAVTGKDLGDTGNSLTIHDGKLYIVVNGSNRIEVLSLADSKHLASVNCPSGASPRHLTFADNGLGFISNLYKNSVSVFDPAGNTLLNEIPVGNNPEQLLAAGNHVYVANSGFGNGRTVSVIDVTLGAVAKTLNVGDNPAWIARVNDAEALVLCTGAYNDFNDPNDDTPGMLYLINTAGVSVTDSIQLGGHPQRLALDGEGYCYTVQADGIQRVHLDTKTLTDRFIPGYFYSLAFDAKRSAFYVTNPLDYVQAGRLEVYSIDGVKLSEHTVGIIPGAMTATD
jgi:YVTN family beta-propeller protein